MRVLPFLLVAATATAAFAQQPVTPGRWEITTIVNRAEIAGAPAAVSAALVGKPQTASSCVTAEQASHGLEEMIKQKKSCTKDHFSTTGGDVVSAMTCRAGGATMKIVAKGTMTPTSYTLASRAVVTGSSEMTIDATSVGRRVGDCTK